MTYFCMAVLGTLRATRMISLTVPLNPKPPHVICWAGLSKLLHAYVLPFGLDAIKNLVHLLHGGPLICMASDLLQSANRTLA